MNVYAAMLDALDALHPRPVHFYDICDEPKAIKNTRAWLKTKAKGPMLYPIHGYPLYGDLPFTIFRCQVCGSEEMGSPWEKPTTKLGCFQALLQDEEPRHEPVYEPVDDRGSLAFLNRIEKPDIVARVRDRVPTSSPTEGTQDAE